MNRPATVDAYIAATPPPARTMLRSIRRTIKSAAPQAEEKISYGMPYFGYKGRLIYFAAFTRHVSIFPMMDGATRKKYAAALRPYLHGKVTMQVPIGQPVPLRLITQLVKARVRQADQIAKLKHRATRD